jgi:hypothetical protein
MAKDGSKVVFSVAHEDAHHMAAVAAALNAKTPFNAFFSFTVGPLPGATPDASPGACIMATGQWSLPGNARPAHGTMQTWAEGYTQALKDAEAAAKKASGQ